MRKETAKGRAEAHLPPVATLLTRKKRCLTRNGPSRPWCSSEPRSWKDWSGQVRPTERGKMISVTNLDDAASCTGSFSWVDIRANLEARSCRTWSATAPSTRS
jgi:hypothetical protein